MTTAVVRARSNSRCAWSFGKSCAQNWRRRTGRQHHFLTPIIVGIILWWAANDPVGAQVVGSEISEPDIRIPVDIDGSMGF